MLDIARYEITKYDHKVSGSQLIMVAY